MQQGCTFVLPGIEGRSFLNIGIAAGACGFQTRSVPKGFGEAAELHECPYHMRMALRFNFGGHFGCTNRLFVAEEIAPILRDGEPDTTSS